MTESVFVGHGPLVETERLRGKDQKESERREERRATPREATPRNKNRVAFGHWGCERKNQRQASSEMKTDQRAVVEREGRRAGRRAGVYMWDKIYLNSPLLSPSSAKTLYRESCDA